MNKSKSLFAIFLIGLFSLSIIASGCSKDTSKISSDTTIQDKTEDTIVNNQVASEETADLTINEEIVDADIGELDELEVSDEIPLE